VSSVRLIPPAIAAKLNGPLKLTARLDGTPDDLAFNDIKLTSNLITADASGTFRAGTLQANMTGALPDLAAFDPNASGGAQFAADIDGPTSALSVKAKVTAPEAILAGRPLKDLIVDLDGKLDPASPSAKLTATGSLDGQAIDVAGELVSKDGLISIPTLKADIGRNTLSASLSLSQSFRPTGSVTFDMPDIGLLAALAGQQASGDLKSRQAARG
jgi:translocation and assembly module TamB